MFIKSSAVVLSRIKHSDSKIITNVLTSDHGKISLIVHNKNAKKSPNKALLFQPLNILDIEFYSKENRNIQNLKDASVKNHLNSITTDYYKQTIALFISEILNYSLRDNQPEPQLFNFVKENILFFNELKENSNNFHLYFLAQLIKYLGFEPGNKISKENKYLNAESGLFVNDNYLNSTCFTYEESKMLDYFLYIDPKKLKTTKIPAKKREKGLNSLLEYYSYHIPCFKKIKSYEVLKAVFHS